MKKNSARCAWWMAAMMLAGQLYGVEAQKGSSEKPADEAASVSGGLLKNGSFEAPDDEGYPISDKALGWGRWGNWMNRETSWSPTRTGNCLLAYRHWQVEESTDSGVYQDVEDVPAGRKCLFTIYAMKDEKTNIKLIELRLEAINGGTTLAKAVYKASDLSAGKWTQLSATGDTAQQGARVLVVVTPHGETPRDGSVKFDDAELTLAN